MVRWHNVYGTPRTFRQVVGYGAWRSRPEAELAAQDAMRRSKKRLLYRIKVTYK